MKFWFLNWEQMSLSGIEYPDDNGGIMFSTMQELAIYNHKRA